MSIRLSHVLTVSVVVEKPITEDLASAERLVQVKDETGNLLVPFQSESIRCFKTFSLQH